MQASCDEFDFFHSNSIRTTKERVYTENIKLTEYDERYANGRKKIYYKRALLELYAPYSHNDGLVKRLTLYKNLDHTDAIVCWQMYRNRDDSLESMEMDFETNQIIENYASGRSDSLRRKS